MGRRLKRLAGCSAGRNHQPIRNQVHKTSLALHRWEFGLLAAIFLFIDGVTGGIMAWGPPLDRMLADSKARPVAPVYPVPADSIRLPFTALAAALEKSHPGYQVDRIAPGQRPVWPGRPGYVRARRAH